jgi:integrase
MYMTSKKPRRGRGEGSIFQRKDGRYAASMSIEGHGRKRKYFYGKTRAEVREKLHKAQLEQRQGILATGPKQTVKDFLNYWLEVHKTKIKVSTYSLYRRHLDLHILPSLGHIQLQRLTADQVQLFYSEKQIEGLQSNTVRAFHVILSAALRDAVRWKRLPVNICTTVTPPRLTTHEIQPLSKEQARKLLEVAKESRLHCLLTLALATGMRLGELLALRWEDIDLKKGILHVRHTADYIYGYGLTESEPKTASSRRNIILPQFVVEELELHNRYQKQAQEKAGSAWEERGLVFPNNYGRHFNRSSLQTLFKKVIRAAGLPDIRFHDLRHSAATILLSMGVPAKVVQEILGHSHISITLGIYAHVLPGMHKEAMKKMQDWFGNDEEKLNSTEKGE